MTAMITHHDDELRRHRPGAKVVVSELSQQTPDELNQLNDSMYASIKISDDRLLLTSTSSVEGLATSASRSLVCVCVPQLLDSSRL